jgi:hypothetical protein
MVLATEETVGVVVTTILAEGVGLATTVGLKVTWGVTRAEDFFLFVFLVVLLEEVVEVETEVFWVAAVESSAKA